jgi:arabinofuranosyltransferase
MNTAVVAGLRRSLPLVAALAAAAFAVWNAAGFWAEGIDDAYISLRYAANLAAGLGPVYNPGDPVEGFSNPTLVALMALGLAVGLPSLVGAKLVGLAAHGAAVLATAGLAWELARPDGRGEGGAAGGASGTAAALAAALSAGFVAVSTPANWWPCAGLETSLYAGLLAVSYWRLAAELRRPEAAPLSAALGGLAALTRPEAPLVVLGLFLGRLAAPGRPGARARWLAIFAVPTLGYLAFRLLYFGFPLPNTYYEKRGGGDLQIQAALEYVRPWLELETTLALSGVAGLLLALALRPRRVWPVATACVGQLIFVLWNGYDWMANQRFVVPALPLLAAGAGAAAALLAARAPGRLRWLPALAVVAAVGFQGYRSLPIAVTKSSRQQDTYITERAPEQRFPRSLQQPWAGLHRLSAWTLARIPPGATVAHTEIGLLGWVGDYTIVDLAGLVDKHMSGATGLSIDDRVAELGRRRPDWVFIKGRSGEPRQKRLREADWLGTGYEVQEGLNGTMVARRLDAPLITDDQILSNFERAIAREPRNMKLRWEAIGWRAYLLADPAVAEADCAAFARDFPEVEAQIRRCPLQAKPGRERPDTPVKLVEFPTSSQ